MSYEFADESGLKLLEAYPVRRDGRKVYVKPEQLTVIELMKINAAVTALTITFSGVMTKALKRAEAERIAGMSPEQREEELTDPDIQHKIRGRGWKYWSELTPTEQAKIRERERRKCESHGKLHRGPCRSDLNNVKKRVL